MERLDHLLELGDLLAAVAGGGVGVVRREEADRVVAPVVGQPALDQGRLADELVHRQQLDRGDAEVLEVVDDRRGRQPGVRAAQLLGHPVVQRGHALDVQLVDDAVAPAVPQRRSSPQSKSSSSTTTLRGTYGAESAVAHLGRLARDVAEDRRVDGQVAADRLRERVEQQLVDVEPQPLLRVPRPGDPVAVAGARRDVRDRAVPDAERLLGEPVLHLAPVVVEQADPGGGRPRCVDREVRRLRRPGRAERPVAARPHGCSLAAGAPQSRGHPRHCSR